jgi:hypothetical protein
MEVLFEDIQGKLGARSVELPVPAGVGAGNECLGMGLDRSSELTRKLRDMNIATANKSSQAQAQVAGTGIEGTAHGNPQRKKQEVVDVRSLFVAGAVS